MQVEFSQYFKAALLGTGGTIAVSTITNLAPNALLNLVLLIAGIWVSLKIYQTAVAYFVKVEIPTSTIFWATLGAGILGGIVVLVVAVPLALVFEGINVDGVAFIGLVSIAVWLAAAAFAALFFRSSRSWPAVRPLSAYWKPFYAGMKFEPLPEQLVEVPAGGIQAGSQP